MEQRWVHQVMPFKLELEETLETGLHMNLVLLVLNLNWGHGSILIGSGLQNLLLSLKEF
jgi:hypothetical protein